MNDLLPRQQSHRLLFSLLFSGALWLTGCGEHGGGGSPAPGNHGLPAFTGVWVIVMENHGRGSVLDDPAAVNFRDLVSRYASAANYSATKHPSLPNYIDMTCGCDDDHKLFDFLDNPASDLIGATSNDLFTEPNLGGELETAGVAWRAYAQDSDPQSDLGPCTPADTGEYVSRHFPFIYFKDVYGAGSEPSASCIDRLRVFGDFKARTGDFYSDLSTAASTYYWITPDKIYDMHDGTIADGDEFLGAVVPEIQATPQWQQGGVIFITFDEGELLNQIVFLAVSPFSKVGYQSPDAFTHLNFLGTVEDVFDLPRTGGAIDQPNMADLFDP